ncbi:conserved hypothetical protein [Paecilomyces variotii No. 5]|uniref:Restriction of telomere capping protein 5 n=1 Tax=Byssochlamys spectabilis (strain No. 5 / NBRC 109023) TaxID=1356009 RepID=V5G226_BYSSN|nr:conserved hypothetical protein [Paecilomyces variotii No. 5]
MASQSSNVTITAVRTSADLEATKALFTAYVDWLDLDLSFQDFETEMASMPGKYAPPTGELLLARDSQTQTPLGCIALRPLPGAGAQGSNDICEMKRLYVSPLGRGHGLGKKLIQAIIEAAKTLGYKEIRLDTLPKMEAARRLYPSFGFREIEPYYDTPLEGTFFLGLRYKHNMGAGQSTDGAGNGSPEQLSYVLAERFATKCFTPLELTHFKDNFFTRAVDQAGLRYWNEKILSDFLGIPDGADSGAGHDSPLDAGPVIFRMVSYLGAFPFQTTLAPSVLTFEAMVKVAVLLTERYGKVLKRGRRDRIKLLFGSLADVGRKEVEPKVEEASPEVTDDVDPAPSNSHVAGFAIDDPVNDEEYEDDDDDLVLSALESLDAIEVFKHDQRIDKTVYEARISVNTFRRLLMLLLVISPLKQLEPVSRYTSNIDSEHLEAVRKQADSILAAFSPEDSAGGISYKSFARTISEALPHLFDPLTPLFEHLLFSRNLDLSRRRANTNSSDVPPEEKASDIAPAPPSPVLLQGSFTSEILNQAVLSHLSFFLSVNSSIPNLFYSRTRLHPVFSTAAHGQSLTSFSHHVLSWQSPTILLLRGALADESSDDESLITIGAYLPQAWKPASSVQGSINPSDPSTLPCLFQLSPTHAVFKGNPSASASKSTQPVVYFSTSTGVAIGCRIPPSSRNKVPKPTPEGAGSLLIDGSLETADLYLSTGDRSGAFLPPVPPDAFPSSKTSVTIYDLEIWGLVPAPEPSADQTRLDAIAMQRSNWDFEAREAERRRNVNTNIGGAADKETARALLEMAGIVGDSGKGGGSV